MTWNVAKVEAPRKNEYWLRFVVVNLWWNKTNNNEKKGKQRKKKVEGGWRVVKNKELKKIDSWEETEEESWNNGLANEEDCRDWSHM
jgi:hypothetical protein